MKNSYSIITVIGSHAGEDLANIFLRKQKEITDTGFSYWLIKSFKARTLQIQALCDEASNQGEVVNCYFIEASQKNGAKPTYHNSSVKFVSENNDL
jgi:hypothetical protein